MTRFRFKLKGGYVIGALEIPTDIGSLTIATVGGTKADALMRAGTIAQRIAEDPVMSALIPPQAHTAIVAAKALSVAAKRGPKALKSLWGKLKGAGKKRLAEALQAEAKTVGDARYFGRKYEFEQPNRGAWQRYQDPYEDDADGYDADAESYDENADFDAYELGRRKKRRKGKRRGRMRSREREPELPTDEPPPPYDEPPPPPGYEYAPEETSDIVDADEDGE